MTNTVAAVSKCTASVTFWSNQGLGIPVVLVGVEEEVGVATYCEDTSHVLGSHDP